MKKIIIKQHLSIQVLLGFVFNIIKETTDITLELNVICRFLTLWL